MAEILTLKCKYKGIAVCLSDDGLKKRLPFSFESLETHDYNELIGLVKNSLEEEFDSNGQFSILKIDSEYIKDNETGDLISEMVKVDNPVINTQTDEPKKEITKPTIREKKTEVKKPPVKKHRKTTSKKMVKKGKDNVVGDKTITRKKPVKERVPKEKAPVNKKSVKKVPKSLPKNDKNQGKPTGMFSKVFGKK